MSEEKLYNIMESALSGVQYVEERTNSLCEEIRKVDCEDAEINTAIFRDTLFAISDAINEIETLLFNPSEIRKEERKTAARYDAIRYASHLLSYFERPELAKKELSSEELENFYGNFSHHIRIRE